MAHIFDLEKKVPVVERKKFKELSLGQVLILESKVYIVLDFIGSNGACPLHSDGKALREEKNREIKDDTVVNRIKRTDLVELGLLKTLI